MCSFLLYFDGPWWHHLHWRVPKRPAGLCLHNLFLLSRSQAHKTKKPENICVDQIPLGSKLPHLTCDARFWVFWSRQETSLICICRFPHGKSRTSAPTLQLIISSKYGVQRIPSNRWSKHAAGTWPCFFYSAARCFIRLLQVSMTTSRPACQLFNSPKHLTQVIVDTITLVPRCLHTNATEQSASAMWRTRFWAVRPTQNDTQSSRTSAQKSDFTLYCRRNPTTVLLQCLRVSTSKKR